MKVLATSSTANSRLLARVSSSRPTTAGSSDWAEVSNRVSPTPSSTATRYSMGSVPRSTPTARARPPSSTNPTRLTRTIDWRRSSRSAKAPGTGASSQGGRGGTGTPGRRGEQRGEPGGTVDPGDQDRRPGELHGKQGQGDPEDAVGQVGEPGGDHGLGEVPSQRHEWTLAH